MINLCQDKKHMAKISFSMRINPELKKKLDDAAKNENRTTANLVEYALLQYLERHHPLTDAGIRVSPDGAETGDNALQPYPDGYNGKP